MCLYVRDTCVYGATTKLHQVSAVHKHTRPPSPYDSTASTKNMVLNVSSELTLYSLLVWAEKRLRMASSCRCRRRCSMQHSTAHHGAAYVSTSSSQRRCVRNSAKRSKLPAALSSAAHIQHHLGVEKDGCQIVVLFASRARKVDEIPAVGVVHTRARLSHTRRARLPAGHSSSGQHHTSTQVHASACAGLSGAV